MNQKTCLFCIGTAEETIRVMPLYRLLKEQGDTTCILQTGWQDPAVQMLHQIFDMPADATVELPPESLHQPTTAALLDQVDRAIAEAAPDMILVAGGSATALTATLAAYARNIPVAHLNAGSRTYDETPSTEEKNQELIARLAHWHFTATEQAMCNLLEERIAPTHVYEVGDTLIDAAFWTREHLHAATVGKPYSVSVELRDFLFQCRSRRLILVAMEHPATSEEQVFHLMQALVNSLERHPESLAVWLSSAAVQPMAEAAWIQFCPNGNARLHRTGPLAYPGLVDLLARCKLVVTDSEHIAHNASAFGKPVLFNGRHGVGQEFKNNDSSRPDATLSTDIAGNLEALLQDSEKLRSILLQNSPLGDGDAASRIATILSAVR